MEPGVKRPLPSSLPLPRSRLTNSTGKSVMLNDIYGRLNVHLVQANATAITFKDSTTSIEQNILFLVFMQ